METYKNRNLNLKKMKNNKLFKALLIGQTLLLLAYTILAFKNEGPNLFDIFLSNILKEYFSLFKFQK